MCAKLIADLAVSSRGPEVRRGRVTNRARVTHPLSSIGRKRIQLAIGVDGGRGRHKRGVSVDLRPVAARPTADVRTRPISSTGTRRTNTRTRRKDNGGASPCAGARCESRANPKDVIGMCAHACCTVVALDGGGDGVDLRPHGGCQLQRNRRSPLREQPPAAAGGGGGGGGTRLRRGRRGEETSTRAGMGFTAHQYQDYVNLKLARHLGSHLERAADWLFSHARRDDVGAHWGSARAAPRRPVSRRWRA